MTNKIISVCYYDFVTAVNEYYVKYFVNQNVLKFKAVNSKFENNTHAIYLYIIL